MKKISLILLWSVLSIQWVNAQTITKANLSIRAEDDANQGILTLEVTDPALITQVHVEIGSSEGLNDRLDANYPKLVPGRTQGNHFRQIGTRIMIPLGELSGSAPHYLRIRLKTTNRQLTAPFLYTYSPS